MTKTEPSSAGAPLVDLGGDVVAMGEITGDSEPLVSLYLGAGKINGLAQGPVRVKIAASRKSGNVWVEDPESPPRLILGFTLPGDYIRFQMEKFDVK